MRYQKTGAVLACRETVPCNGMLCKILRRWFERYSLRWLYWPFTESIITDCWFLRCSAHSSTVSKQFVSACCCSKFRLHRVVSESVLATAGYPWATPSQCSPDKFSPLPPRLLLLSSVPLDNSPLFQHLCQCKLPCISKTARWGRLSKDANAEILSRRPALKSMSRDRETTYSLIQYRRTANMGPADNDCDGRWRWSATSRATMEAGILPLVTSWPASAPSYSDVAIWCILSRNSWESTAFPPVAQ